MQTEIGNIKSVQQKQAQTLQNEEKHHHNIEDKYHLWSYRHWYVIWSICHSGWHK
jgi:hypothetical protein